MKSLSELGERKAIELVLKSIKKADIALGPGDDCAAIKFGNDYLLLTTDMISQKTHISKFMKPYQIGWYIVAINLSDIASMGGVPLGILLSYGFPKKISEQFLKELTRGANSCAVRYGTYIIGGDIKESSEINISGTAIGKVRKDELLTRKGAKSGDIVAVTGTLGNAGAGYYNLKYNILKKNLSKSLFEPIPKISEGGILAKMKCVSSCMDISDGLSSSLYQLGEINSVGFEIEYGNIPISDDCIKIAEKVKNLNIFDIAFHFGGDYELLLTLPKNCFDKAKKVLLKKGYNLFSIGRVKKSREIVISKNSENKILENKGYEHFKKRL